VLLLARDPDAEFDQALEWTVSQRDGGRPSVRRTGQRSIGLQVQAAADESDSKHDTVRQ